MRITAWMLTALLLSPGLQGAAKPKAPSAAQLQAQVKKLTQERDALKAKLEAQSEAPEDLAAALKSRDLAREEAEAAKKELEQLRATLNENQNSADALLKDLQKTKQDLAAAQAQNSDLRKDLEEKTLRLQGQVGEGALVVLGPEVTPAIPMNLRNVLPKLKKARRGTVVVNVLVSETGEVLATRLLQGLPGSRDDEWTQKANEACVEAAKRLVFDPARASDGQTKVKVWQGVGFYLE